jgi:ketosteroid isomerase-like protein
METILEASAKEGFAAPTTRRATYVFRESPTGEWLCVIDNSYGTDLLEE